ncbi:MAG: hypothetical protein L6Q95_18655 [Planctomycetes bacterium]|nr:hypothetical protein [Planctomycetota bacterium]
MRRTCALLLVLAAACASDKYVHIEAGSGQSLYAKREEAERVDANGMIHVKNVVTGKTVSLKRDDCAIRSASKGEVNHARGQDFLYDR